MNKYLVKLAERSEEDIRRTVRNHVAADIAIGGVAGAGYAVGGQALRQRAYNSTLADVARELAAKGSPQAGHVSKPVSEAIGAVGSLAKNQRTLIRPAAVGAAKGMALVGGVAGSMALLGNHLRAKANREKQASENNGEASRSVRIATGVTGAVGGGMVGTGVGLVARDMIASTRAKAIADATAAIKNAPGKGAALSGKRAAALAKLTAATPHTPGFVSRHAGKLGALAGVASIGGLMARGNYKPDAE